VPEERLNLERNFGSRRVKAVHSTDRTILFLTELGTIAKVFRPNFVSGFRAELGALRQTEFTSHPMLLSVGQCRSGSFVHYRFEKGPALRDVAGTMTGRERTLWIARLAEVFASLHRASADNTLIQSQLDSASRMVNGLTANSFPAEYRDRATEIRNHLLKFPADTLLHGDPFFKNIIVTDRGPILIDFEWAARGLQSFDLFKLLLDIRRFWSPTSADQFLVEYTALTGLSIDCYHRDEPIALKQRTLVADLHSLGIWGL